MDATHTQFKLGRRPILDGLRGVAILLVLARHADVPGAFSSGVVGVDLFFVLSGFLITSLLIEERIETGRVALGRFYARRALRLLPALTAMLVVYVGWVSVFGSAEGRVASYISAAATFTYTLPIVGLFTDIVRPLEPMWTLATEEWFYFIWPIGALLLIGSRLAPRVKAWIIVALIAGFALARGGAFMAWGSDVYFFPTTWAGSLLGGCLIAVALEYGLIRRAWPTWPGWVAWALLIVASLWEGTRFAAAAYLGGLELVWIAAAVLILQAVQSPQSWAVRWVDNPVMRWFGKRSYGIYLWNGLFLIGTPDMGLGLPSRVGDVLGIALTLLAAEASWWAVERPALRLKKRFERPGRKRVLDVAGEPDAAERAPSTLR